MQWLTDLFKQVTVSRPLTGAFFLTAGWALFGKRLAPTMAVPVPEQWHWIVALIFIFSTSLLLIWYMPVALRWLKSIKKSSTRFDRLSKGELRFMKYASTNKEYSINLNQIIRRNPSQSKIELLVVTTRLIQMGYLRLVNYDEDNVQLTDKGRNYVFKNHRDTLA